MPGPPNILIIHTDQQRYDSISCNGGALVDTPAIDSLAESGVLFDRAYTCTGICAPQRASLLTGLVPMRHGTLVNPESGLAAGSDFDTDLPTYASALLEAGYSLDHCGKWHVGNGLAPGDLGIGGPDFPGYGNAAAHESYGRYLAELGLSAPKVTEAVGRRHGAREGDGIGGVLDCPAEATVPHFLTDMAIDAISRREAEGGGGGEGAPWCVRLDFWAPHLPYLLPEEWARKVDPADVPMWPSFDDPGAGKPAVHRLHNRYWGVDGFDWAVHSRLVAMYLGFVAFIDFQIGRLLAHLDSKGLRERTAIFFTTDHGGMVGSHRLVDKGPFMYEDTYHTPLICSLPDGPQGDRRNEFVMQIDLMPTMIELAGGDVPAGLDGRSLLPLLGGDGTWAARECVFAEFHGHQVPFEQRMVRSDRYKYIFNASDMDELYDLQSDPWEISNLIDDGHLRDVRRSMRESLLEEIHRVGDPIKRYFAGSRLGTG